MRAGLEKRNVQCTDTAILMGVFNGEAYLDEMLESLREQTCQDFICYLHDDGSTDGSVEIIRKWTKKDSHFVAIEGPPTGSAKDNFLWMLGEVEAKRYFFADQDDVWLPEKIEKSLLRMDTDPELLAVFSDLYVTDARLRVLSNSFLTDLRRDIHRTDYRQVLLENLAAGCTLLINKKVRDAAFHLPHKERIDLHDHFLLSLAAGMGRVSGIDEPLVLYRQHDKNEVGASKENLPHRIRRNLKEFIKGNFFQSKKAFIRQILTLSGELSEMEAIPEERRGILKAFAKLKERPKLERIRFCRRQGFRRNHGNFWLYLWI